MEQIRCPHCGKRLFDLDGKGEVKIVIKCPRCRTITAVDRHNEQGDNVPVR